MGGYIFAACCVAGIGLVGVVIWRAHKGGFADTADQAAMQAQLRTVQAQTAYINGFWQHQYTDTKPDAIVEDCEKALGTWPGTPSYTTISFSPAQEIAASTIIAKAAAVGVTATQSEAEGAAAAASMFGIHIPGIS